MKTADARSGFAALLLSSSLLAQGPITAEATIKKADPMNRQAPTPVAPITENVALSQKAPAGVSAPKECHDAWFGTLSAKKKVAVIVGKAKADAQHPDAIWMDLDGDGKFAANEQMALDVSEQEARGMKSVRSKPVETEFDFGGTKLAAKFAFSKNGDRDPFVNVSFPTYLEATVKLGDAERIIAIQDKDLDGKFDGGEDLWTLSKAGDRPGSAYGMSSLAEQRFEGGKLVGIKLEGGSKVVVNAVDAKGPDPKSAASHRHRVEKMWSDRFDLEREGFVKQQKVDTARPRTTKGIEWHYVTFDEALALGKKSGKPVFVDVLAFWCVWCYRMDYYTYIDKEVAEVLNTKFVPVKIIQEQDLANDYKRLMDLLEAKGIPAMGIFDGDGKKLHMIGGWKKPVDFLTELEKGLQK